MLIPFSVRCLLAWLSWFGAAAARWPVPPQASQPASQQHTPMYSRLFVVASHIYIYIYIYIYAPHHTDRQRHRSTSLSLSISIHSLFSCCLHTLTPPPHDSRHACVCVCAFGSLSSNASDVPITGHIMI